MFRTGTFLQLITPKSRAGYFLSILSPTVEMTCVPVKKLSPNVQPYLRVPSVFASCYNSGEEVEEEEEGCWLPVLPEPSLALCFLQSQSVSAPQQSRHSCPARPRPAPAVAPGGVPARPGLAVTAENSTTSPPSQDITEQSRTSTHHGHGGEGGSHLRVVSGIRALMYLLNSGGKF